MENETVEQKAERFASKFLGGSGTEKYKVAKLKVGLSPSPFQDEILRLGWAKIGKEK